MGRRRFFGGGGRVSAADLPIANPTSTKMNKSFIQKETRRIGWLRNFTPRRWNSQQMKMAERTYPPLYMPY